MSKQLVEVQSTTASVNVRYPPLHRYERRLIIVGLILLAIGGIAVYNTNAAHSYQSTFNVLPGRFFKITTNLRDQTLLTGNFRETTGRIVNFYVMNSVQFAAFQLGQGNANLFALTDVPDGSVTFTSSLPDAYYLVFTHGTGLLNMTETVNFQRTYVSLDEFQIISGVLLLILGGIVLYWGMRPKHKLPEIVGNPK